jgi:hypothetical protein
MRFIFGLLFFLSIAVSKAQFNNSFNYWEWGIGAGSAYYQGEMTPEFEALALLKSTRPHILLNYKYSVHPLLLLCLDGSYSVLSTKDEYYTQSRNRGWEMNTHMMQLNSSAEINLRRFGKFHCRNKWTFYLKGGGGVLLYNPTPTFRTPLPDNHILYNGSYSALNIFGGGGIKIRTSYNYMITLEGVIHYAFTDRLEGWDRDFITFNDMYGYFRITIQRLMMGANVKSRR